ncbi:glycosyltransferase [Tropicibacter oceani]|uniref:Glycosyltransferase n=1 Tax=Tropicibacter oceani TaxID=3058420 RepID=A0ABY8QQ69_9RHOB|nr:glycosyltransferase [Tropicibacter oceani]WGW06048.1 glycosyltransferase [Tropicibacter oceani]
MRILYFNWVDYLDDEARGGGVSVYQRNLMAALADMPGVEASFLCSGVSHDFPRGGAPRWEQIRHGPDQDRARRFEIVNSAVLAPAHHGFGSAAQLSDPATEAVFADFIEQTGPYDVIHFNTLEGLPASVLALCARWPQMRVILSLHNYYPFCPQVNLWHQERETCGDFDEGRKCVHCLPHVHDSRHLRLSGGLAYRLKLAGLTPGTWTFDQAYGWTMRIGGRAARLVARLRGARRSRRGGRPGQLRAVAPPDGAPFAARRAQIVDLINRHCHAVLGVSDAVCRLAQGFGVTETLLHTSYIGTREASAWAQTTPRRFPIAEDGTLRLAYLGYMRRDKGFYFLLHALETMPPELASRLRLEVAARRSDRATMDRLSELSSKLAELTHADGYAHDDLDRLLGAVDVGLVPVLWHDNLPQVAIEMHARHIPLLCADMGGAPELGRCPDMTFAPGDIAGFHDRIAALLNGEVDFDAYWQGAMPPVEMSAHLDDLMAHYRAL